VAQPLPKGTLHQESPKNLINANWTSVMGQNTFLEVSSTYFHMHWPSTWRTSSTRCPTASSSGHVQRDVRHLHRRSRTDRRALPRRLSSSDEHRRHALHRRLPRRQPSAQDRFRELVDATGTDGFVVFDDTRIRYTTTGTGVCNATVRTGCVHRRRSSTTRR